MCLIVFLVISNIKINKKRQEMNKEVDQLKQQVEILQERKDSLEAGLSQSQEEDFQEERLREQGYKKPGEEVIAVLQNSALSQKQQQEEKKKSFWLNLWQKIKSFNQ